MDRRIIRTDDAPAPIGPYSQAIAAGGMLFTAGQIGLDASGELAESVVDQAEQALRNLEAVLIAGGASCAAVVKTTIFLLDLNDFAAVNEVYGRFFHESPPARSTVQVSRLPKDARVEIEAIALVAERE